MIKIDKKEGLTHLLGTADQITEEISIAMMALLDQAAEMGEKFVTETASNLAVGFAIAMKFIEEEHDITIDLDPPEKKPKKEKKTIRVKFEKEE